METTKLSSKGQIILPKTVRDAHDWRPGTEFAVENTGDGVLLKPVKPLQNARLEDVFGCLKHKGKASTLKEMEEAIEQEVRAHHARGRY